MAASSGHVHLFFLKLHIRKQEEANGQKLSVHHIDYDKTNIHLHNLISLCRACHSRTNHNREDWIKQLSQAA